MKVFTAKTTYTTLFAILAIILILLPFMTTFNNFLTRLFETLGIYRFIEEVITPYIIRLVVVILRFFKIEAKLGQTMFSIENQGEKLDFNLSWNCLGWQSLILLTVSLFVGLQGNYTRNSKIECTFIGILGTFLLNLSRIVAMVFAMIYINPLFAFVLHEYLATLITIIWLFIFWWFSYGFVLVRKGSRQSSFAKATEDK